MLSKEFEHWWNSFEKYWAEKLAKGEASADQVASLYHIKHVCNQAFEAGKACGTQTNVVNL